MNQRDIDFILDRLRSGRITRPYIKNLIDLGFEDEVIKLTLEEFTGGEVNIPHKEIRDRKHKESVYCEWDHDKWMGHKYDERGNEIYYEDSTGFWIKYEYDWDDNFTYYENSKGQWIKREYDKSGDLIYHETSNEGIVINKD
jgi:hypothetical protein